MARCGDKTASNVYYQARIKASMYNDRLKSREGAAHELNVHPATLTKYENGTLKVGGDIALLMAEIYEAPELANYYCTTECPIGRKYSTKLDQKEISMLAVQMHIDTRNIEDAKEKLMDITADGIISCDEEEDLHEIMNCFEQMKKTISEMELWYQKNIKKEAQQSVL